MKRTSLLPLLLAISWFFGFMATGWADGRPGSIVFSDGRKMAGDLSLTPGKDLLLYTATGQVSVHLEQAKAIRFVVEKEQNREGFYFPDAGQTTQVKTGEFYPVRYLKTQITLTDGQTLEGHLYTTTVYVETDDSTQKVVLMAKQTGTDNQKLTDLPYPTTIQFDDSGSSTGSSSIDLTSANLTAPQMPVILGRPDLTAIPAQQVGSTPVWTIPLGDNLLFSVQAADGFHVAWPAQDSDPTIQDAVQTGLKNMQDFYDTRTLLGCFDDGDAGDVYALVLMKRVAKSYDLAADVVPWGLVMMRWKYDPDQKKVILLGRVTLGMGRAQGNSPLPTVFKDATLLNAITPSPAAAATGTNAP